jgi:hypothetical protein
MRSPYGEVGKPTYGTQFENGPFQLRSLEPVTTAGSAIIAPGPALCYAKESHFEDSVRRRSFGDSRSGTSHDKSERDEERDHESENRHDIFGGERRRLLL